MSVILLTPELAAAFWAKVDVRGPDQCWQWLGYVLTHGYGQFRQKLAHRIAWMLTYGEIPEGLHCLHRCDRPLCCNPAHLFLGTNLDNIADKVRKRRHVFGERVNTAILTETAVQEIRGIYALGGVTYKQLGATFGVSKDAIGCVIRRETWKQVA